MDRRIRIGVFAWVPILLVGIGIGLWWGRGGRFPISETRFSDDAGQSIAPDEPYVGEFRVARVIDVDTIEIEGGERVRYIGMDTPESVTPGKPVQCFGKEASDENRSLVEGKMVRLGKDMTDRDRYGRLLRHVFVGDMSVNLELVALGFARADAFPSDTLRARNGRIAVAGASAGVGRYATMMGSVFRNP